MRVQERLRTETRQCHVRLEQRLDLLRDGFDREDLRRLLARFYGFYKTCEAQLAEAPEELQTLLSERRKCDRIVNDLVGLGVARQDIARLPVCELPTPRGVADTLGQWYVLEGSTLGGQMLARHFRERLDLCDDVGLSFFLSYGPEVGTMWKSFCRLLDEHISPGEENAVVDAANRTFQSLEAWMCGAHSGAE